MPVRQAQRGDVVVAHIGDADIIGICIGADSVFVIEDEGLIRLPTLSSAAAWKV